MLNVEAFEEDDYREEKRTQACFPAYIVIRGYGGSLRTISGEYYVEREMNIPYTRLPIDPSPAKLLQSQSPMLTLIFARFEAEFDYFVAGLGERRRYGRIIERGDV